MKGIVLIEVVVSILIVLILVAIGFSGYKDFVSPKIDLNKKDWVCDKTDVVMYMAPMVIGNQTAMMPQYDEQCVSYVRK